jgi:hypothetical protein
MSLAVLAVAALLLAGETALAKDLFCLGGKCVGTERADQIFGTDGMDKIAGRDGGDIIFDDLFLAADDVVHGGAGPDVIRDDGGPDVDTIFGGKGDDAITVRESFGTTVDTTIDVVDCGPGEDTVFFDPTDNVKDCEILNPR